MLLLLRDQELNLTYALTPLALWQHQYFVCSSAPAGGVGDLEVSVASSRQTQTNVFLFFFLAHAIPLFFSVDDLC